MQSVALRGKLSVLPLEGIRRLFVDDNLDIHSILPALIGYFALFAIAYIGLKKLTANEVHNEANQSG
jgi:hypothetical protein